MSHVIWPAALALCRWLGNHPERCLGAHVLELGAGSGAPGLVALTLGAASLTLTDGDEDLLELMQTNCELNVREVPTRAALCAVRELDWRQAAHVGVARAARPEGCSLVLATDVTFGAGDFEPLVRAAAALLERAPRARLLLARSTWFEGLQHTLLAVAEAAGLQLLQETEGADEGAAVLELGWSRAALAQETICKHGRESTCLD